MTAILVCRSFWSSFNDNFGERSFLVSDQASAGRRRPRRTGFSNFWFSSWDTCIMGHLHNAGCIVSQKVFHQSRRLWIKNRTSTTTLGPKFWDGSFKDTGRRGRRNSSTDSCAVIFDSWNFGFFAIPLIFWISENISEV